MGGYKADPVDPGAFNFEPDFSSADIPANMCWAPAAFALNLTGLGLGYLYTRRTGRWLVFLALTAGILVGLYAWGTQLPPAAGIGIVVGWPVLMALDGLRLVHNDNRDWPFYPVQPRWLLLVVALVILGTVVAGFLLYGGQARKEEQTALGFYRAADCARAEPHIERARTVYRLAFTGNLAAVENSRAECARLEEAQRLQSEGDLPTAIVAYQGFLGQFPASPLVRHVQQGLIDVYSQQSEQLRQQGQFEEALKPLDELEKTVVTAEARQAARQGSAQIYWDWAGDLIGREKMDLAVDRLETLQADYGDTPVGGKAAARIGEVLGQLAAWVQSGTSCKAMPGLNKVMRTETPFAEQARALMPEMLFGCGKEKLAENDFDGAKKLYNQALNDYPDSPVAAQVQAALVDLEVAEVKQGETGTIERPAPSGTTSAGQSELVISNDAPERIEILFSGLESQKIVMAACASCKIYQFEGPATCPEMGPQTVVRIPPGTYDVVVRSPDAPDVTPWYGSWDMLDGDSYFECFFIVQR